MGDGQIIAKGVDILGAIGRRFVLLTQIRVSSDGDWPTTLPGIIGRPLVVVWQTLKYWARGEFSPAE